LLGLVAGIEYLSRPVPALIVILSYLWPPPVFLLNFQEKARRRSGGGREKARGELREIGARFGVGIDKMSDFNNLEVLLKKEGF
jgi:hypothetical protein